METFVLSKDFIKNHNFLFICPPSDIHVSTYINKLSSFADSFSSIGGIRHFGLETFNSDRTNFICTDNFLAILPEARSKIDYVIIIKKGQSATDIERIYSYFIGSSKLSKTDFLKELETYGHIMWNAKDDKLMKINIA